nr:endoglucanase 2-like [Tanacetum cinerariifolium]
MAGSVEGGGPEGTDDREETPPPLTKEQIEGHVSTLKSLIKSHNQRNKGDPIRLDFESKDTEVWDLGIANGKEVMDEDLGKPFKEARRTPLTRRIIEFAGPEYKMPANIKLYDGTTDPEDHLRWFERLPHDSINEWADLREAFAARYSVRRACFKEPHEITKIFRKDNESLTSFKERRTVETGFIMGVPEVMKISSFMDSIKSPELAKRFSNKVPTTVNEMMERQDDFVRSEEAYAKTKLPKGEVGETHRKTSLPFNRRDNRSSSNTHPGESRRNEYRSNYRSRRDAYLAKRTRDDRASYPPLRGEYNHRVVQVLTLESLTKRPKEILATETQLHLPAPRPMLNPLRSGNTYQYCDYHQEKGHCTNDCIQLRKQLEMALESRKLNHLVKDVRQRERGPHGREAPQPAKEPLIVEAEVEGYLVRRVYVDEGSSVEVMFEHCFENLDPRIRAKLKDSRGRNLAANVDDMVIKSKDEKMLLADLAETFDNLKRINMKLNPKKCSFGVEEGKFLGYMVTSEGIRANPKKTKDEDSSHHTRCGSLPKHCKSSRNSRLSVWIGCRFCYPDGLIWVSKWHALQQPVASAFLAVLFSDYMLSSKISTLECDSESFSPSDLHEFAISQADYVLGDNPMKMSYLVGYGDEYPKYVHHRGASIPADATTGCKDGMKWLTSSKPNLNVATGAHVGGPSENDKYIDSRNNSMQGEPSTHVLVGLLSGLVSTSSVTKSFT